MGKVLDGIDEPLGTLLESLPVFFVATAPMAPDGMVNCSPKETRGEFAALAADQVA